MIIIITDDTDETYICVYLMKMTFDLTAYDV